MLKILNLRVEGEIFISNKTDKKEFKRMRPLRLKKIIGLQNKINIQNVYIYTG